ncbi:hypothetical protein Lalb_Chr04g0260261 [Lupinus albus]|uniref:Uncharacterized protein n=1 Tax=Lupinus albus TaxID=3870 RepID=A0A6A4QSN9_LUPAL|nr:hypothetical protein Lalb_Chr04g0260261 [Lupinus albus]
MPLIQNHKILTNPLFRSESFAYYNNNNNNYVHDQNHYSNTMIEKRQLFLRSYQFSRKKKLSERIKGSLVGVKKVVWLKLKSAMKLRRLVFSRFRIKCGFYYRRSRFSRLINAHNHKSAYSFTCC